MRRILLALACCAAMAANAADVAALAAGLSNPEAKARSAAASELWKLGKDAEAARPQLVAALQDPAPEVAIRAAGALSTMGMSEEELAPTRKRVLDAPNAYIGDRFMAARGLVGREPDARLMGVMIEWLAEYPTGNNAEATGRVMERIARRGDKSLIAPLEDALKKNPKAEPILRKTLAAYDGRAVTVPKRNLKDSGDWFNALMMTDVESVAAFLDAGASPTESVAGSGPPLVVALQYSPAACSAAVRPTSPRTVALVKLLLDRGAGAAQADPNGNTPLMAAALKGCDREVTRLLIKGGSPVGAVNRTGMSAFELGLAAGGDGLDEIVAAGYRLPPAKAAALEKAYAGNAPALARIRKAQAK